MKPEPQIRRTRVSDRPELLRLIRAYYRYDRIRFDPRTMPGALRTLLRRPSLGRVWVAAKGIGLVAYLVLTYNYDLEFGGNEGIITELYVEDGARGAGLGGKLIDAARAFCHKSGIGTVELQVSKNNRRARAFYWALGFREFDRIVMAIDTAPTAQRRRQHQP
jgi:ribosomal protein S18 acetylase RimI-like enzyme